MPGDFTTALFAESILAKEPGGKVIYDVRASWAVPEAILAAGGEPLMNRVGHAFIKQRMREEGAVFGGEVSAHYYFRDFTQADSGVIPFLLMLELVSARGQKLSEILAPFRARYFLTGEINTRVADVALKLQELKERFGAGGPRLAPRRPVDRGRRLALQRPPVEHRAAAAPEPRGALAGADGAQARRGAGRDPGVTEPRRDRARACHRREAAVQVRGLHAGRLLGHRRAGRRLLRPLPARTSTSRAPSTTATSADSSSAAEFAMRASNVEYHAPARFDDLLEMFVRVERIGTHERHLRVRRLPLRRGRHPTC